MRLIKDLKITTLAENSVRPGMLGQWGLSFLLDFVDASGDDRKIVFDTGVNKRALLHNIKQLKVDLRETDCVVLSHGHSDHTAATVEVVKVAGGVNVYAHPHTFLPRFLEEKTGKRRRIGVPKRERLEEIEKAGGKVLLIRASTELAPGVWTTGQIERVTHFEEALPLSKKERLIIVVEGKEVNDQILDDQALWMNVSGFGPFVITGCAHAGPVNTLLHVQRIGNLKQIRGLVGGTHLVGRSNEYLEQTIKELENFDLKLISPCHCTGFKATTRIWQAFPDAFILNYTGRVIEVGKEPDKRVF